jgi:hypothetical protein
MSKNSNPNWKNVDKRRTDNDKTTAQRGKYEKERGRQQDAARRERRAHEDPRGGR